MLTMDKERAASADVLEYRVARMYDNEECYPQDIVSLVLEYQGSPAVNVTTRGGSTMSWSSSSYHTELTSASISAVLNQASTYLCTLTYDANGSLPSYPLLTGGTLSLVMRYPHSLLAARSWRLLEWLPAMRALTVTELRRSCMRMPIFYLKGHISLICSLQLKKLRKTATITTQYTWGKKRG